MKPLTVEERARARNGLNALVGSPFRKKQIEDGKEGLFCKYCNSRKRPIVSPNGSLHCGACEALLFDGTKGG